MNPNPSTHAASQYAASSDKLAAEDGRARDLVQTQIDETGHFSVRKHTVLITATR